MRNTFSRIARTLNARRAEAQLGKMPDYLLKDIGISRSEIGQMVRTGGGERGQH